MKFEHPISIAPMMDRTDRHFRYLMRLITSRTLLYTEMVTANAILHGDKPRHLNFHSSEHPISLQLGGDSPDAMAEAAQIGEEWGYDEVNINVGCPSDRVKNGNFGACLMAQPELVASLVREMKNRVSIPVTVKHRIGIDEIDSYEHMKRFVEIVAESGADRFSVHARKAWLQGLSPKENREIPPLRYSEVWKLKEELPHLVVEINGGVRTIEDIQEHLEHVDAVMIGRAAYDNPWLFSDVDSLFYSQETEKISAPDLIQKMVEYTRVEVEQGERLPAITRHLLHLFHGLPGARVWRRHLSENSHLPAQRAELIQEAFDMMREKAQALVAD